MRKILVASIFVLAFCAFAFGQDSNCPTISVTGPAGVIEPDGNMEFTASVSGIDTSKIGYKWTVSEGTLVQGQGTNRILVNIKGFYDNAITATVEILNLPEGCPTMESETGVVACRCIAVLIDEFGKIPYNDQNVRLAVIKDELDKRSEDTVYIILYHPAKDNKNLNKRIEKIKNFLLNETKIPEEKLVVIFGGDEPEERTRIWLVPPGAEPPTP